MMLDKLNAKINKNLQNNIKVLIEENLLSINFIKDYGFNNIIEYIKENISFKEYLNFRALNIFKNEEEIQRKIQEDNTNLFNSIIKLSPHLADQYLESFFNLNKSSNRESLIISSSNDIVQLSEDIFDAGEGSYDIKVLNPFTNNLIDTRFLSYEKIPETIIDSSFMLPIKEKEQIRDGDKTHIMNISMYDTYFNKDVFTSIKGIKPEILSLEFTLYHECAHASFAQMTNADKNKDEKNSDITAIIKIIKNHDLNQEESQELCNNIIKYRIKTNPTDPYLEYTTDNKIRIHYTTDAILSLKSVIKTELEEMKKIPDNKISRYSNFLIELNTQNESVLFGLSDHTTQIDKSVIQKAISDHYKETTTDIIEIEDETNQISTWLKELKEKEFEEILFDNKILYEDVLIQVKLKENFEETISILTKKTLQNNPMIGMDLRKIYNEYQTNQENVKVNISDTFNSKDFSKSINKINRKKL